MCWNAFRIILFHSNVVDYTDDSIALMTRIWTNRAECISKRSSAPVPILAHFSVVSPICFSRLPVYLIHRLLNTVMRLFHETQSIVVVDLILRHRGKIKLREALKILSFSWKELQILLGSWVDSYHRYPRAWARLCHL